ncbi:ABC transporter ATP-binding protein [Streptomyces sulfonofaciens]|uniref:ABC transporter ATP-binding protein n=1 Tax=Streptomyces sulfonofaciens TaxID=68272 RepID=A0A919L7P6_9ACTN|nr:ABC transporter ATP-binding protein [Streptomyces sulfonofaciens]GHH85736.1 ABC transporter ATP-binding protein [Streptomyces sulfonofaciens]
MVPIRGPAARATRSPGFRLLVRLVRQSGPGTIAVLGCTLASAAASLATPAVVGRVLDALLHHGAVGRPLGLCAALMTAEVVLDAVAARLTGGVAAHATAWVRHRAMARLLGAPPGDAARFTPGSVATRLTANAAEAGSGPPAAAALAAALPLPVGAVIALAVIDPWTAAAFAAGLPLLVLVLRAFARTSSHSVARYQHIQSQVASRLGEALSGARTIAAAGLFAPERDRVLAPLPALAEQGALMWRAHGKAVAHSSVLMPLLTTWVLAVGGLRLAAGVISVGDLLAASRYAALAAGLGAVAGPLGTLVRARAAAGRLTGLIALPELGYGRRALPPDGAGTVDLRGVCVVRDGRTVLRDVDLHVPGGATVAVVGRSGAGKSALAAVMGRLADPTEGHVLLDGVDLREVDRASLRQAVAFAFARPFLFGDTLTAALSPCTSAGGAALARVREAARAASAEPFVRLLPRGYDTPPGAASLSGGELQRLGLARAFAQAQRLLILDDATSSLDTVTEQRVQHALTHTVRARTRVVVAHRLATAAGADLVVWLENGTVRGVGPHHSLERHPGYRAVFTPPDSGVRPERDHAPGPGRTPESGAAPTSGPGR